MAARHFFICMVRAGLCSLNELRALSDQKKYIPMEIAKTETKKMSFSTCKTTADKLMSKHGKGYPLSVLHNSDEWYRLRLLLKNGAIETSCIDGKLILRQWSYK
ncbi:hypothetical protein [Thiomicrorhabdus heinhorstiae]|uniref:Uncharacterized protein n=1 Tax=Thiomicrorhabdus heinhorstiae TaxID=2748010 RepID=A0ABS0BW71_9GAMM|nr:hypothetical protein [Thiomicrorhabdus heinhorstiae]MBF6057639.1 hypothetical protein [Thiomicrorhabdus heinhorstiae]